MKRILVITYYWPPNGGAGVYRWLKFCKYLPEHGWAPVVYTPSNPELTAEDPGLLRDVRPDTEVIKRPIREPFALYKRFTGRAPDERLQTAFLSEEKRGGWRERLALWVRANLFIPDARIGWVRPSVRFLTGYLREHPVDAVVTTGPPHSMHLIGLGLKRSLGVKWLADFRDPWTGIDFFGELPLTRRALAHHQRLEREVLTHADRVVAIGWGLACELEGLRACSRSPDKHADPPFDFAQGGSRSTASPGAPVLSEVEGHSLPQAGHLQEDPEQALCADRVEVVTNGYDADDLPSPAEPVDERWSLVHVGSLSATRDCPGLWRLLAGLCAKDQEFGSRFTLRFVGPVDRDVLESVRAAGLGGRLERVGRVPHHEAMRAMQRARVLLLSINDTPNRTGILTGKLFEYLSTGRPILAVGPEGGDVARVLGGGHLLLSRDTAAADGERVLELFRRSGASRGHVPGEYARPALAARMARLLDGM